jgi:hypothetical protein
MKITALMNQLQTESKKTIHTHFHGCGFGEFCGHQIKARSIQTDTQSKFAVVQTTWFLDGKRISREKLEAKFS